MANRVSNEQILNALAELPAQIAAAIAGSVPSVASPVIQPPAEQSGIKVPTSYKEVMQKKNQEFANKYGEESVLYAKHNTKGEVKLAYALRSKFANLNDPRFLGVVAKATPKS